MSETISKQKAERIKRDYFEELPKDKQTDAEKEVMASIPLKAMADTVNKQKRDYKRRKVVKRWFHVILCESFWSIVAIAVAALEFSTMFLSLVTIPMVIFLVLQLFCTWMNILGYKDKDYKNSDNSIQIPHGILWYL